MTAQLFARDGYRVFDTSRVPSFFDYRGDLADLCIHVAAMRKLHAFGCNTTDNGAVFLSTVTCWGRPELAG